MFRLRIFRGIDGGFLQRGTVIQRRRKSGGLAGKGFFFLTRNRICTTMLATRGNERGSPRGWSGLLRIGQLIVPSRRTTILKDTNEEMVSLDDRIERVVMPVLEIERKDSHIHSLEPGSRR